METNGNVPWVSFRKVVDDLVGPPLAAVQQAVTAELAVSTDELRSLRVEQREMAEQLKRVERFGGEQYDALIRDDRGRVQLFNRLVSAVDSQSAMSVELRSIAGELRHEQVQARERMLTLEHRLSALHRQSRRSRTTWIVGALCCATFVLVLLDLLTRG
jgi:hypothetical protein